MPVEWTGSIEISVPPQRLWDVLLDPDADSDWRAPWVRSVRTLSGGPIRVGSRYESHYNFYVIVPAAETSEITAVEPPRLLAWRTGGRLSSGTGSYMLEPVEGGTRFTLSTTHAGRGLAGLLDGPFGAHLRRDVWPRQLEALKRIAEAKAAAGDPAAEGTPASG